MLTHCLLVKSKTLWVLACTELYRRLVRIGHSRFHLVGDLQGSNCRVLLGSLDARRLQTCLMVDRGIFVYRLSYTFTVEYEQPILDMHGQPVFVV